MGRILRFGPKSVFKFQLGSHISHIKPYQLQKCYFCKAILRQHDFFGILTLETGTKNLFFPGNLAPI